MKLVYRLAVASALIGLTATPALAGWRDIGQIRVDRRMSINSMPGPRDPVRSISLNARRGDVVCDYVRVFYRNGSRTEIFSGRLERGRLRAFDLPGRMHHIDRVASNCRSDGGDAAITVGAYLVDDRGSDRGFDRDRGYGSDRGFDRDRGYGSDRGGPGRGATNYGVRTPDAWHRWRLIANDRFSGRGDTVMSDAGQNGSRLEQLALKPVDNDASCSQLDVQLRNGNRSSLDLSHGRNMEHGLFYVFDLPGDRTDVRTVWLRCRARDGRDVRIEVWGKHGG